MSHITDKQQLKNILSVRYLCNVAVIINHITSHFKYPRGYNDVKVSRQQPPLFL